MNEINCPNCKGSGWLCEDHRDKPWEHDACGGAGARCMCNPDGGVMWEHIYAELMRTGSEPIN